MIYIYIYIYIYMLLIIIIISIIIIIDFLTDIIIELFLFIKITSHFNHIVGCHRNAFLPSPDTDEMEKLETNPFRSLHYLLCETSSFFCDFKTFI